MKAGELGLSKTAKEKGGEVDTKQKEQTFWDECTCIYVKQKQ